MRDNKKQFDLNYLLIYTILFSSLFFCVFSQLILQGKTLIWEADGATQYYPYLYYMGNYFRDIIESVVNGEFAVRMYDFALGMGDDINSIVRFHPLDFLSAIVPGRFTEILYVFLVFLRMYLSGLSFSLFCFYWNKHRTHILAGSMMYVFCGYVLIYGMRHPTFHSPMIILPLLLVGAEQVIRKENGLLFAFMTALGFISNYYFMYMCSIAMACYVLLRFFGVYKENRIKNFFIMGIRLVLYYLLGMGMICVILLPTVIRLTDSMRLGESNMGNLFLYDNAARYYGWFMNLIAPYKNTGDSTSLNYAVILLPALTLLFTEKWKKHLTVKIALLIQCVGILVPLCGFVFSGFSDFSNRWIFIFSFTVCFACVTAFEKFTGITKKQMGIVGLAIIVYMGAGVYFIKSGKGNKYWNIAMIELLICMVLVLVCFLLKISAKRWSGVILAIVLLSCICNGYFTYNENYGNVAEEYCETGELFGYYTNTEFKKYQDIEDRRFYRVDSNLISSGRENASVLLGYNGVSMYNSIINSKLIEYLLDQENPGVNAIHRVFSLDGRAASETLANVKYYMTREEDGGVPYGFLLNERLSDEIYKVYENRNPLSIGVTYDAVISNEDYEMLNALEKQQIMMEAAVIEADLKQNSELEIVTECGDEIQKALLELPREGENLTFTEYGFKVGKEGGSFQITYEKKAGYETYLRFKGFYKDTSYSRVDITTDEVKKHIMLRGHDTTYTLGRENYLVNLGYCEEDGTGEVTISMRDRNRYDLEGIELYYVSMDRHDGNVEKLNREALQDVVMKTNGISGTVSVEKEKLMVFSIPYSKGWTAYVDGERADLIKANVMYMGLKLEPGKHEIVLKYCTPGIVAGLWISIFCTGVFLFMLFRKRKKRYR